MVKKLFTLISLFIFLGSYLGLVDAASYEGRYKKSSQSRGQVSGMPTYMASRGEPMFVFNPKARQWGAYDASGQLISSGVANGGGYYCPDIKRGCHSPVGAFRVLRKGDASCKSTLYPIRRNGKRGGAPMPYCMFFSNYYAIHGYPHLTGSNVSHGCIRVSTPAAQWLHDNFINIGTKVIILPY